MDKENLNGSGRGKGRDYEVGYGRPPKHSQFQKGRSPNPGGRGKQPSEYRDILLRILNEKLSGVENGKRRRMTRFELGLTARGVRWTKESHEVEAT